MNDSPPSAPTPPSAGVSELQGLDPGELLARGADTVHPSGGAGAWEPPTVEDVGRLLPQYRVERLIGRGGMGAVYKGVQLNLDRPVAIKLLPAEMAADTQFVARFEREARILAKVQHSRIVTIYDFGRTAEGHLYFVMEYIDGTDLRTILRGPGLMPDQALAVVGQLCDALQGAHREGIVHRDLKPENVLITSDGYVKLADFGLARPTEEAGARTLTATNLVLGTPDYMAPEQRSGAAKADARSDIFALGVLLYEMLTGQPPRGAFDPPSHKVRVDVRVDEVVLKALQSEPERRYQQASELKTDVDHIRTTPLPQPATPAPSATSPWKNPNVAWLAGSAALLLLATLAALIWDAKKHDARTAEHPATQVTHDSAANGPMTAPYPSIPIARRAPHSKKHLGGRSPEPPPGPDLAGPTATEPKATPSPAISAATPLGQALVAYHWSWARGDEHGGTWRTTVTFHQDGTASNPAEHTKWYWWVIDERTVHVQFRREEGSFPGPNFKLGMDLTFNADRTSFRGIYIPDPGGPMATGERKLPTGQVIAESEIPVAQVPNLDPASEGKILGQALVASTWSWARGDGHGSTWRTTLTFHQDGTVSNPTDHVTWYWWVIDDHTAHVQFHQQPGSPGYINEGMELTFNAELTNYRGVYLPDSALPVATGGRLAPTGEDIAEADIPIVRVDPASALERRNFAANLYEALVADPWEWATVGDTHPPIVVIFKPDGHVSGGWTWHIAYKPDGTAFIDCSWVDRFPHHQYLIFSPSLDTFDSYDMAGNCVVKGRRVTPKNQTAGEANAPSTVPSPAPPPTPAATD